MPRFLSTLASAVTIAAAAATSCSTFANNYNTEYTTDIDVGTPGQTLRVVPDSGSSDLLIDSTVCVNCGGGHEVYDPDASTTALVVPGEKLLAYGQGVVECEVAKDTVTLGSASATTVPLMLMTLSAIQGFTMSPYDGVMGLGRDDLSDEGDETMLKAMGYNEFAICFGTADGSPGRLELGAPIHTGGHSTTMGCQGSNYWGLYLTEMSMDGENLASEACSPKCAAIVDSGTSLLTMPTSLLNAVREKVGHVDPSCSNINELPDLEFVLGGHTFSMPPETYIVKTLDDTKGGLNASGNATDGNATERLGRATAAGFGLSHLYGFSSECMLAIETMDEETDEGPMIILGQPFMRAYAATFSRQGGDMITLSQITSESECTSCSGSEATSTPNDTTDAKPATADAEAPSRVRAAASRKTSGAQRTLRAEALEHPITTTLPVLPISRLRHPFWAKTNTTKFEQYDRNVSSFVKRNEKGQIVF
jgi:hypothetical protein